MSKLTMKDLQKQIDVLQERLAQTEQLILAHHQQLETLRPVTRTVGVVTDAAQSVYSAYRQAAEAAKELAAKARKAVRVERTGNGLAVVTA